MSGKRQRLFKHVREKVGTRARRLWMKFAIKGVFRSDAFDRMDLAYIVPDPWKLQSEAEYARFRGTSERLERAFGKVETLLEIGCGEGVQSEYLAKQCAHLTGLDISARAIARAKQRLPNATFLQGDLRHQAWATQRHRYDVVTACEVLYYVSDIEGTLKIMSHVGKHCLVTIFDPLFKRIGHLVTQIPGSKHEVFSYESGNEDTIWHVIWWSN